MLPPKLGIIYFMEGRILEIYKRKFCNTPDFERYNLKGFNISKSVFQLLWLFYFDQIPALYHE